MSDSKQDGEDTGPAVEGAATAADVGLRMDIVTLFPHLFDSWMSQGVVSRAVEKGVAHVNFVDIRPFGIGRHLVTDDYPFGGGPGMVMKPEPLFAAIESLHLGPETPIILLSPAGRRFDQRAALQLDRLPRLVLL